MIQEKVTDKIIEVLEKLEIDYMFTGAIAVNFYGQPRSTHDLDIVIEIKREKARQLVKGLGRGFLIEEESIWTAIREKGMVNALHLRSGLKVDFWMLKEDKYDRLRFKRKKRKKIFQKKAWLISPEDLIVTKLVWFEKSDIQKHFEDARGILQIQEGRLNLEYLQKWAKKQKVKKLLEKLR